MDRPSIIATIAFLLAAAATARAANGPAAVLIYPYIVVDGASDRDTLLSLSNTSATPLRVRCSLENANRHCTNTEQPCGADAECGGGSCKADWRILTFDLQLTARQPLEWRASQGLSPLPCSSGECAQTSEGQIPAVDEVPFLGVLTCVTLDTMSGMPSDRNDLTGSALLENRSGGDIDLARYEAIAIGAVEGANDSDFNLVLGGSEPEYEGCPNLLTTAHRLDGAADPIASGFTHFTRLVLVPCTRDPFGDGQAGQVSVDYLVINEFEQQLLTRRSFEGLQTQRTSALNPFVFDAATAGSEVAQTRIRGRDGGILGIAIDELEADEEPARVRTAARSLTGIGLRVSEDTLGPAINDCGNGRLDAGEECDDGNLSDGDCCSSSCVSAQAGTPCADDLNTCTADVCDAVGICTHDVIDPLPDGCGCCQFQLSEANAEVCAGDCDGSGTVDDSEVEICRPADAIDFFLACPACDADGDFTNTAFDFAVVERNHRLGCPPKAQQCAATVDVQLCQELAFGTLVPGQGCYDGGPGVDAYGCAPLAQTAPAGDCSRDGETDIVELQECINAFLIGMVDHCALCDTDGDESVDIPDLQGTINCFLDPTSLTCPQVPVQP